MRRDPAPQGVPAAVGAVVEVLLMALALPCLVLAPDAYGLFGIALIALGWLVRWLTTGRLSARTPADWALVLLAALMVVGWWISPLPDVTWPALLLLLAGLATLNFVASWAVTERRLWWGAAGIVLAGVLLALLAPFGVGWSSPDKLSLIPIEWYRAMPARIVETINPNVMAGALAVVAPLPLALICLGVGREQADGRRAVAPAWLTGPLLGVVWLLLLAALVFTQSRGALMATALAAGVVLAAWQPWTALSFLVMGEALALLSSQMGGRGFADYMFSTNTVLSWEGRQAIWSGALQMVRDFPLTGIGLGTFKEVMAAVYPMVRVGDVTAPHAHNLLLQVGVDLGGLGVVAYLGLWLTALVGSWRAFGRLRRAGQMGLAALAAGVGAGLVALMVHGMFDAVTWGTKPAFLAWAVMGLGMALEVGSREYGVRSKDAARGAGTLRGEQGVGNRKYGGGIASWGQV